MRKPATWGLLTLLCVSFISCSKDNNDSPSALSGSWTFTGMHAVTSSTASYIDGADAFKDVTTSEYTTTDNVGAMNISGKTMTGTGIGYSTNMLIFVSEYENNEIVDTFSTNIPLTLPPTNSAGTFEQIGNDSIHYTSASMLGSGGAGAPVATGAKFTIAGDLLTLTSNVVIDKIVDTLGETITQHETALVVTTLKKQ